MKWNIMFHRRWRVFVSIFAVKVRWYELFYVGKTSSDTIDIPADNINGFKTFTILTDSYSR